MAIQGVFFIPICLSLASMAVVCLLCGLDNVGQLGMWILMVLTWKIWNLLNFIGSGPVSVIWVCETLVYAIVFVIAFGLLKKITTKL